MNKSKHTQGVLRGEVNINDLGAENPRYTFGIGTKVLFHTSFENSRPNANQVMKCWNSYKPMLDALRAIAKIEKGCKQRGCGYDKGIDDIATAAIALVKKGV